MEKIRITAPLLDSVTRWRNHNDFKLTYLTKESQIELEKVVKELNKITPSYNERDLKGWTLWFTVPRGTCKDYTDYSYYYDEETNISKKEILDCWRKDYPMKDYWYKLTVATEKEYTALRIDNAVLIRQDLSREENNHFRDTDYTNLLKFLKKKLKEIILMMKEDTYNEYVENNLPFKYREGVINRKKLWELNNNKKEYDLENLSNFDIEEYEKNYEKNKDCIDNKPYGRLKTMTANKYYEICSYCYKAAEYERLENKTPREMYQIHGDYHRDGGLSQIDGDDENIFDEWYASDKSKKYGYADSSHMWEMRCGHTHTMIHLYLEKDNDGYYLSLYGGIHCNTFDVVRMYNKLNQLNIPVYLYNSKEIFEKILGKDKVGICSSKDTPWHFWYGGFYDNKCISFTCIEKDIDKYIPCVEWRPIRKYYLVDKGGN